MKVPTKEEAEMELARMLKQDIYSTNELPYDDLPVRVFRAYLEQQKDLEMLTSECVRPEWVHPSIRSHAEHLREKYGMEAQP